MTTNEFSFLRSYNESGETPHGANIPVNVVGFISGPRYLNPGDVGSYTVHLVITPGGAPYGLSWSKTGVGTFRHSGNTGHATLTIPSTATLGSTATMVNTVTVYYNYFFYVFSCSATVTVAKVIGAKLGDKPYLKAYLGEDRVKLYYGEYLVY